MRMFSQPISLNKRAQQATVTSRGIASSSSAPPSQGALRPTSNLSRHPTRPTASAPDTCGATAQPPPRSNASTPCAPASSSVPPTQPASTASTSAASSSGAGRDAVVVGAGPAGCCAAMYLARAGWKVTVFERRPEPGPDPVPAQRSWPLALDTRGLRAVRGVLDLPPIGKNYKGMVIKRGGEPDMVLERIGALVDRTSLANTILAEARKHYAGQVAFHFGMPLQHVDLAAKTATFAADATTLSADVHGVSTIPNDNSHNDSSFSGKEGIPGAHLVTASPFKPITVPYNLLVGADGAKSAVRDVLMKAYPDKIQMKFLTRDMGLRYKSWSGLPQLPEAIAWNPDSGLPQYQQEEGSYVFMMRHAESFITICQDGDGTYSGFLMLPKATHEGIKEPSAYEDILLRAAPDLPMAWAPLIAKKLMTAPLTEYPTMRQMTQLNAPGGAVLIGDAAHAMTAAMGQGVNSSLEDCPLLDKALKECPDDIDRALANFSAHRLPQVHALQEMEMIQNAMVRPLKMVQGGLLAKAHAALRKATHILYTKVLAWILLLKAARCGWPALALSPGFKRLLAAVCSKPSVGAKPRFGAQGLVPNYTPSAPSTSSALVDQAESIVVAAFGLPPDRPASMTSSESEQPAPKLRELVVVPSPPMFEMYANPDMTYPAMLRRLRTLAAVAVGVMAVAAVFAVAAVWALATLAITYLA